MHKFSIYEEGFMLTGMDVPARAHLIGFSYGDTFLDACKQFIRDGHPGEICSGKDGVEFAHDWGCRWFPTLEEAQKSFG